MVGTSSDVATVASRLPGVEVIEVRCETGALATRVRRRIGAEALDGERALTEHWCRKCRDVILRTPAYHRLERSEVAVYHYVDPVEARVVETRAILYPRSGSQDLNHGGRQVPRATFEAALKLAGY